MRRLQLWAYAVLGLVVLPACEAQESIIAIVLAILGAAGVAVGIAGRKHNRNKSQEHAYQVAENRRERDLRQDELEDMRRRRELKQKIEEVRAAAQKHGVETTTEKRLVQVEREGGVSSELLEEMLKEINS